MNINKGSKRKGLQAQEWLDLPPTCAEVVTCMLDQVVLLHCIWQAVKGAEMPNFIKILQQLL